MRKLDMPSSALPPDSGKAECQQNDLRLLAPKTRQLIIWTQYPGKATEPNQQNRSGTISVKQLSFSVVFATLNVKKPGNFQNYKCNVKILYTFPTILR